MISLKTLIDPLIMLQRFRALFLTIIIVLGALPVTAQNSTANPSLSREIDRPRLVVGIVVDQMRYEYISRFWSKFGDDGFKRLIRNGYSFTNHHYNYFPTYTGPGHAAIYTGTTPSVNGIVGNSWYERRNKSKMYVVSDTAMTIVGGKGDLGKMSPANLLSTTVTDELKQAVPQSKVIAVSIKDRGAVLPAGHLGDSAFWYDDRTGHFVTSTWYSDELPGWVKSFNKRELPQQYSREVWKPLLDIGAYTQSSRDNSSYEGTYPGSENPTFPHAMDSSLSRIKTSPFGNTLVSEIAKAAVDGESLGSDAATDFLAVSFSSTDYVGHRFGPNSIEVADTYLRLDGNLSDLLSYLDKKVGTGNYIVFLTADHGVVDVPASLNKRGLPGGLFDSDTAIDSLQAYLNEKYGEGRWVETYRNQQVYLDRNLVEDELLVQIQETAARFLLQFEGVASTNTAHNLETQAYSVGLQAMYQRGHYPRRSGDVYIQLAPGWLDAGYSVGTSHGSPYSYDTHVPLIFYGWNIPQGKSSEKTVIPQIAPTISNMLQIEFPNGSANQVLKLE